MKVKVRVIKIQDEEEQYPDIAKAENDNKEEIIENQDEIIENQHNIIIDLKMQLSALKKEYEMVSKQNGYLKEENERLHKSEENNIGLQASMKDLSSKYYKLISDYNDLKTKAVVDYGVLKGEYDHLKAEFNKLYSEYLSYMDKIQKFISDIKGEVTE